MEHSCKNCSIKSRAASRLRDPEMEQLSFNCITASFKKGDSIIRQGVFSTNVAYLRSGLVKVHINGPHHDQIVRIVKAPGYLGLPTTFGDKINQYSVTAIESSEVCFIDMGTFKYLLKVNSDFAYEIMIELCRNELEVFYRCANRTQKQIRGKIADVLLEFSERIFLSDTFIIPLTQEEMGNLVDATRESISRVLAEFENDGIIQLKGRTVQLKNKEILKEISSKG
ncbi:MAG TPA: Crp/Fnr family transcriptional regulator [Bacteroidales bacterium]|nr:Crp/Fnr family transcriptional regulator [Bacteroidales bacterium]HQK36891.1 Crp/Fnr family transcriptional regulator [Bacteroidales bacterium]